MTLRVDVLTLFPDSVRQYASTSVLGRAGERGVWELHLHDIRDETDDVHRTVENTPDLARPLFALTPSGRPFTQDVAVELSALKGFSLLCGRYEGFDQRAIDLVVDDELSLGDFVLAGGELAALCVIEAVVRLLPGALGNDESSVDESFSDGLLEYPHYTKPANVRGREVPEVLRSGNHGEIARWRRAQALARTIARRPDLIAKRGGLSAEDRALLGEFTALDETGQNG